MAYHSINAYVYPKYNFNEGVNQIEKLNIETLNLNNEPISAECNLKIYSLIAPKQVFRARPWEAPDYHNWTEQKFRLFFPYETFANEDLKENYPLGELVLEQSLNTGKENSGYRNSGN